MFLKREINFLEKIRYSWSYRNSISAYKKMLPLKNDELFLLEKLKKEGCLVIENFVEPDTLKKMSVEFQKNLESLGFKTPCLGQSLISVEGHADLIENNFYASDKELQRRGLMFSRDDVNSLEDAIDKFNPSTLTANMLDKSTLYQSIWLDEKILRIVAGYMGLVPTLAEAYVRRTFPSQYKVMNHFWHRDLNHKHYLLKVFIFLSDCDVDNGPHEYISGTHNNFNHLNGKRYFSDSEVNDIYPENSEKRMVSKVKAGTVIIEDTRGLHRAQMPVTRYRDLGFAIFTPEVSGAYFNIKEEDYCNLTSFQKLFVSKLTVI